mmetsp:Transcript_25458/g.25231  ORF Transcript_25458/g.25231 Transcript_25458/m.25231 type:complete len:93 (+) Transcript_25458:149-427(+)
MDYQHLWKLRDESNKNFTFPLHGFGMNNDSSVLAQAEMYLQNQGKGTVDHSAGVKSLEGAQTLGKLKKSEEIKESDALLENHPFEIVYKLNK